MSTRKAVVLFLLFGAAGTAAWCGPAELKMRVTGDAVNLRAGPGPGFETVGQVSRGDVLAVRVLGAEWVEVDPPAQVDLWIYAELVRDGLVAASDVRVRSGPGINYREVGRVQQGQEVEIRGTFGDWLKVAPPPGSRLWISAEYVEHVSDGAARLAARTIGAASADRESAAPPSAEKPAPSPPAPSARSLPDRPGLPAALVGRDLDPGIEQGVSGRWSGVVRRAGPAWGRPSRFRLTAPDARGLPATVCYLLGSEEQLATVEGRHVDVYGRSYSMVRVRYPAVMPERVMCRD